MGKGEDFEREIPRVLSRWITRGERDDVFWRARVRRTSKTPRAEAQLGDIKADDPVGFPLTTLFNIELKRGYSKKKNTKGKQTGKVKNIPWDLLDLIDYVERKSRKEDYEPEIISFWNQTKRDAEISNRIPMLIFKRDWHVPVVVIRKSTYNQIKAFIGAYEWTILSTGKHLFFRLESFLDWFRPELLRMLNVTRGTQEVKRESKRVTYNGRKENNSDRK